MTAVARGREEFIYTITRHGDGTVPTRSAELPGTRCVYARVAHSGPGRQRWFTPGSNP